MIENAVYMEKEELIRLLKQLPKHAEVAFDRIEVDLKNGGDFAFLGNAPAEPILRGCAYNGTLEGMEDDCTAVVDEYNSTLEDLNDNEFDFMSAMMHNSIKMSEDIIKFNRAEQAMALNLMCHIINTDR